MRQLSQRIDLHLLRAVGGGHTIPGGYRRAPDLLLGVTNRDIDATDAIWTSLRRHHLDPGR